MAQSNDRESGRGVFAPQSRTPLVDAPRPGVAEPDRRQQLQSRFLRPAIDRAEADQDILDVSLGVFDEDVEITILIEYACVEEFVFQVFTPSAARLFDELFVWKSGLRIFVQEFHVRMSRRRIEVKVILLHVL